MNGSSNHQKSGHIFQHLAAKTSVIVGSVWAFFVAVLLIIVWAVLGPLFHFSDTWQLVINTATTVITFLIVFLIQNTQNRDARAIHLKLDEVIRALRHARNEFIDVEKLSDEELQAMSARFEKIREEFEKRKATHPRDLTPSRHPESSRRF